YHDKWLLEHALGVFYAAGGAQRLILKAILDMHAMRRTIAKVILDDIGKVLDSDDDLGDAMNLEQLDDMPHHLAIDDRHHWFGTVNRQGTQARAFASGHHNSFHGGAPLVHGWRLALGRVTSSIARRMRAGQDQKIEN